MLRLHAFLPASRANGPGLRAVVWTQGCTLGCPGCFNPGTHAAAGGETVAVEALYRRIVAPGERIEGVTISGGEPLQQASPVAALLRRLRRETDLSVLLFTGFDWDELRRLREAPAVLASVDVVIAGRYDAGRRLGRGLLGSSNQTAHFLTDRYRPADLEAPPAEVVIGADGGVVLSGIDPAGW